MPSNVMFPPGQTVVFQGSDNNGNPQGFNIGGSIFTDADGVVRAHGLLIGGRTVSLNLSQNGLAANTLSNGLFVKTPLAFVLCITVSAAGTVTVFLNTKTGGTYYQLLNANGTALSVALTANQVVALPIPCGADNVAIQSSVATNVTLEAFGLLGG